MNTLTENQIDEFVRHYLVAALWSSHNWRSEPESPNYDPDAGEMMDDSYEPDDCDPESLAQAREDIVDFVRQCTEQGIDLFAINADNFENGWNAIAQHGHDLWLTRNGHGAGFWDRGYGNVGDQLTSIAKGMGGKDCLDNENQFVLE